ncbi:MAG: 2-oxo acid dehydrogenase subunit E2 [Propionibacteriaceae bacterium]|nr:2-oxo acid dehydrogenase subunit E2 [Propionibacteriaceae bacterium]
MVRKIAAAGGIDLAEVQGSGVGGRIRKQDVVAAIAAKGGTPAEAVEEPPEPSPDAAKRGTTEQLSSLRAAIAKRTVESLRATAQLTAVAEVDLTRVVRNQEGYLVPVLQAVADALRANPLLNATFDLAAGTVAYPAVENIAIAVPTGKGVLNPVVKNAAELSAADIAKAVSDLTSRAQSANILPDDLAGATFSVVDFGAFGSLLDTPVVVPPQVAALGIGAVTKRIVVQGEETLSIRDLAYLSLSYDHRLVDSSDAARFLAHVKARLES